MKAFISIFVILFALCIGAIATADEVYYGGQQVSQYLKVDTNGDLVVPGDMTATAFRGSGAYLTDLGEAATGAQVSNTGLVLGMNFNTESIDGTTVLDSSAYGNHATVSGAAWTVNGGFNGSGKYYFDGVDDFINCGRDSSLDFGANDFTVSCWLSTTYSASTVKIIAQKGSRGATAVEWMLGIVNGVVILQIDDNVTRKNMAGTTNISGGGWYFVTAVRDGNFLRLYVNGAENATALDLTGYGSITNTGYDLFVGKSSDGTSPYTGFVDDFRTYNRALSADEIKALSLQRNEVPNAAVLQKHVRVDTDGMVSVDVDLYNGYAATIHNGDGSSIATNGMIIKAGNDANGAGTTFISFQDGDGTQVGNIESNGTGAIAFNNTSDRRLKEDETTTTLDGIALLRAVPMKDWRYKPGLGTVKIPVDDGVTYTLTSDDGTTHSFAVELAAGCPVMILDGYRYPGTKPPSSFYVTVQGDKTFLTVPLDGAEYEVLDPLGTTQTLSLSDGPSMTFNGKTFHLDLGIEKEPLRTGFIAQDLEPYYPAAVGEQKPRQTVTLTDGSTAVIENTFKTVRPMEIIPVLWEINREQQELIDELVARVTVLEGK